MAKKSSAKTAAKKKETATKKGKEAKVNDAAAVNKEQEKIKQEKTDKKNVPTPEEKLQEAQDRYLRLSAEFDNYRKRTLKEKTDLLKSAGESTIIKFLPVMDDFDRAMGSIKDAKDIEAVKAGIELIFNKLKESFAQTGIKEIEALHKDFDTDLHEAVTKIPAPDKKLSGKVVDVIEKGYYLNDKVIRFSKVVIGE
jgi:molecular chaperone GrpE